MLWFDVHALNACLRALGVYARFRHLSCSACHFYGLASPRPLPCLAATAQH